MKIPCRVTGDTNELIRRDVIEWELLVYKLKALDVMLGMDWISKNHIPFDCEFKRILGGKEQHVIFQGGTRQSYHMYFVVP